MRCAMNKTPAFLTLPLLASLLAGCSTPVPQSLPHEMLPKTFTGPISDGAPLWPEAGWWKGFHDDELASLIAEAQAGNRDLAVAAAHVMEAEAQTTIARSALLPQVNGGANHVNAGCSGQACQNFGKEKAFDLTFNASYELDVWGLAQDNLRAADEQLKSSRFSQQAVVLALDANVADQYLNVLSLRQRIAITNQDIDAINAILKLVRAQGEVGGFPRPSRLGPGTGSAGIRGGATAPACRHGTGKAGRYSRWLCFWGGHRKGFLMSRRRISTRYSRR